MFFIVLMGGLVLWTTVELAVSSILPLIINVLLELAALGAELLMVLGPSIVLGSWAFTHMVFYSLMWVICSALAYLVPLQFTCPKASPPGQLAADGPTLPATGDDGADKTVLLADVANQKRIAKLLAELEVLEMESPEMEKQPSYDFEMFRPFETLEDCQARSSSTCEVDSTLKLSEEEQYKLGVETLRQTLEEATDKSMAEMAERIRLKKLPPKPS
eukprot:gene13463-13589_t